MFAVALEDLSLCSSKKEDTDGVNWAACSGDKESGTCMRRWVLPSPGRFHHTHLKGCACSFWKKKHARVGRALLAVLMCNGRC